MELGRTAIKTPQLAAWPAPRHRHAANTFHLQFPPRCSAGFQGRRRKQTDAPKAQQDGHSALCATEVMDGKPVVSTRSLITLTNPSTKDTGAPGTRAATPAPSSCPGQPARLTRSVSQPLWRFRWAGRTGRTPSARSEGGVGEARALFGFDLPSQSVQQRFWPLAAVAGPLASYLFFPGAPAMGTKEERRERAGFHA